MSRWHTNELSPGNLLIQDGDRVVGSIMKSDDQWRVEILWNGGDLIFVSQDYTAALAYIEGVERVIEKLGLVAPQ